jgi:hypothetical protein
MRNRTTLLTALLKLSSLTVALLLALGALFPRATQAQFSISGTVTGPGAAPVANVDVLLFDGSGTPLGIPATLTNLAGAYIIDNLPFGLPAGDYEVRFDPPTATGLLFTQDPITVVGNTTLNVSLTFGSILSGFVRDTLGVGIPNIDLNFRDENTGNTINPPGDNTDGLGFYSVVIPPAIYRLTYRPVGGEPFISLELRDVSVLTDTAINVTLLGALVISGQVLGPGGVPVFDADFDAVDVTTGIKLVTPGDNTDVAGNYSFMVPPGTYDINVAALLPDKLTPQLLTDVVVTSDITLNFQLLAGVLVSGVVRDVFAAPVVGADIDLTNSLTGVGLFTPSDKTDAFGIYQVIAPPAVYDLDVQPLVSSGLAPVRLVSVPINIDTTIDVTAPNGVTVTGVVQSFSGAPVANVDIDAKDAVTLVSVPLLGDNTDINGAFTTVLPVGTFNVEIEPPLARHLAPVLFSSMVFSVNTSLPVTLDSALILSGTVTDSNLLPLANIRITARDPISGDTVFIPGNKTDILGQYSAPLAPATYDLLFRPDSTLAIVDSSVLPSVVLVKDTVIDIVLGQLPAPTFTLSGTVTDPFVLPVANVEVRLLVAGSSTLAASPVNTDGSGTYLFGSVTAGTYDLRFIPPVETNLEQKLVSSVVILSNTVEDAALVSCGGPCGCCLVPGDADHSGTFNIADVTFMIARIFSGGPPPVCTDEADADGSNAFNIADVTYSIARIFSGGPAPFCGTTGS